MFIFNDLQLSAALCISAEQTFTEASAKRKAFAPALSIALEKYSKSGLRDEVDQVIGRLNESDYQGQLYGIIANHRLRLWCLL